MIHVTWRAASTGTPTAGAGATVNPSLERVLLDRPDPAPPSVLAEDLSEEAEEAMLVR